MRLVFFGDSLTWGGYGGDYVAEVARLLPDHTVINAGRGGDTVVNLLDRLDDVLAQHQPDGMFVMIGGNDAVSYSQPATRPYYRKTGGAPPDGAMTLALFEQRYRELLTQLHSRHVLAWAALETNEYNAETVAAQRLFNTHARRAAESLRVPVLDLMAHLPPPETLPERKPLSLTFINLIGQREAQGWHDYEGERVREGYRFTFDGIHFTPETARQVADVMVQFLNL